MTIYIMVNKLKPNLNTSLILISELSELKMQDKLFFSLNFFFQ